MVRTATYLIYLSEIRMNTPGWQRFPCGLILRYGFILKTRAARVENNYSLKMCGAASVTTSAMPGRICLSLPWPGKINTPSVGRFRMVLINRIIGMGMSLTSYLARWQHKHFSNVNVLRSRHGEYNSVSNIRSGQHFHLACERCHHFLVAFAGSAVLKF